MYTIRLLRTTRFAMLVLSSLTVATPAFANTDYIVQPGDTLCEIAERFEVRCADLMARNGLKKASLIYPGQILSISNAPSLPATDPVTPAPAETAPVPAPAVVAQPTVEPAVKEAPAPEPESPGVDLLAIYQLARSGDPVIAAEAFSRDAAQEVIPQAKAALRPQISAATGYTLSSEDLYSEAASASVSLSQSLYNRASRLTVDQARQLADRAQIDYAIAAESLIQRVAASYFAVLATQDNLELSERNQRAIGRQLELAEERLEVGLGTRTDLYDARARFENAIAEGIEARRLLDDARQALVALVGDDPGHLRSLSAAAPLAKPNPDNAEIWVARALSENRGLATLQQAADLAELEIDLQKAERFPTVGLGLSAAYTDSAVSDGTDTTLTFSLSLPFYQGGLVNARIREAAFKHNAARASYESARRDIQRQTRQAFLGVNSQLRRVQALAEAVRAGESALQAKEEGFAAGLTTNIEVLDAQRDLFRAERDYLKARYDYVLQVLLLEQLAGQLDESDVARINRWLG
ncbi:MAG: TolC family outer membrane protein [Pseudomonadota bacterium]|nr:TolC family outer membrane protein [Pseudomonadota bacterium]